LIRRRPATSLVADNYDATICEAFLLADLIVIPIGSVELRENVFSTGIGFGNHLFVVSGYP